MITTGCWLISLICWKPVIACWIDRRLHILHILRSLKTTASLSTSSSNQYRAERRECVPFDSTAAVVQCNSYLFNRPNIKITNGGDNDAAAPALGWWPSCGTARTFSFPSKLECENARSIVDSEWPALLYRAWMIQKSVSDYHWARLTIADWTEVSLENSQWDLDGNNAADWIVDCLDWQGCSSYLSWSEREDWGEFRRERDIVYPLDWVPHTLSLFHLEILTSSRTLGSFQHEHSSLTEPYASIRIIQSITSR